MSLQRPKCFHKCCFLFKFLVFLHFILRIFISHTFTIKKDDLAHKQFLTPQLNSLSKVPSLVKDLDVKQQIAGVWHFYLPQSMNSTPFFENNLRHLERIWTYDNGLLLSPGISCQGQWKCFNNTNSNGLTNVQLTLSKVSYPSIKIVLKGLLSLSEKPIFEQWNGNVLFHAAQIIGAAFEVQNNSPQNEENLNSNHTQFTNQFKLPEGYQLVDKNGTTLDYFEENAIRSEIQKEIPQLYFLDTPWRYCGNFIAFRILGEDIQHSNVQPHFFSDKGPKTMYSIIDLSNNFLEKSFLHSPSMNLNTSLNLSTLSSQMHEIIKAGPDS